MRPSPDVFLSVSSKAGFWSLRFAGSGRKVGGSLLLSGGRHCNSASGADVSIWLSADGMADTWDHYSISFWHNRGNMNVSHRLEHEERTSKFVLIAGNRRGVVFFTTRTFRTLESKHRAVLCRVLLLRHGRERTCATIHEKADRV